MSSSSSGAGSCSHSYIRIRFSAAVAVSLLVILLLSACATTQPERRSEAWQEDTVRTTDTSLTALERRTLPDSILAGGDTVIVREQFVVDTTWLDTSQISRDETGYYRNIMLAPGRTDTTIVTVDSVYTEPPAEVPDSVIIREGREALGGITPPPVTADQDTLGIDTTLAPGSAALDTVASDSLVMPEEQESDLDTSIAYSSQDIYFEVPERKTVFEGNAIVRYKGMTLRAHRIEVEWNKDLLRALPRIDTLWTDSTETEIDTIQIVGMPTFDDGGQTMSGMLMKINLKTREGYVESGETEYGVGFYRGDRIQKVSDEVLFVEDGYYTTSKENPPDYKFTGHEMKMVWGDKVVGKPVVLRFGDVPAFALPFGIFSLQRGRRSGILIPTYGDDSRNGRHIKDFGYYWAASDYWDIESRLDFYEKSGILLRGDLTYRDRYRFDGAVGGSFNNRGTGGGEGYSYDIRVRHNHELDQYSSIRVDGTYVSSGGHYAISDNVNRRLDQRIRSNATYTRRWPSNGSSVSINMNHEQNLATEENRQTIPNISYSMGRWRPFERKERREIDKDILYQPPEPRLTPQEQAALRADRDRNDRDPWYSTFALSYNNRLQNQRDESLESAFLDGEQTQELKTEWKTGLAHSISLNAPQKVMRYITLNPSMSYSEDWMLERRQWFIDDEGDPYSIQERGFFARRTFRASLSSNTKIYGYFPINRWTMQTIRHVMTPTIGVSYRPDFSDDIWGYYQDVENAVTDTTSGDRVVFTDKLDRYQGSILGGTPRGKSLSLNFGLDNLFQMKRVTLNEKGEEVESKLDLFNYNLNSNYNFAADSLHFGDLSASLRANPIRGKGAIGPLEQLSINLSTSHSFYQWDNEANREVDKLYWDRPDPGLNVLRLTNFTTRSQFALSGGSPFIRAAAPEPGPAGEDTLGTDVDVEDIESQLDRFGDPTERRRFAGRSGSQKPWRLTGSVGYTLSMRDPMEPRESLWIDGTINLKLTERWSFQYGTRIDLTTNEVVRSDLYVQRDLKSWEGSLRWSPQGIGQGFYLRIGIKAPMLQDVQVEQRRGRGALSSF